MFSVGLRYTLVRSVSTRAIVASGAGLPAFRPAFNAYVASRSFAVVADTVKDLEGPKEAVKKPGPKAQKAEEMRERKKVALKAAKEKEQEKEKGAKEKKAKNATLLARKKERERAKKLEQLEKKKANKLKAKEKAVALAAKNKELAKAKEFKELTRRTRPPFKKPLTGYQNFMKSELTGSMLEKPVGTVKNIFADAVAKWRGMTPGEKEAYETEGFAAEMQEYQTKYNEWKKTLNRQERRAFSSRFSGGPSRINAYALFAKETFPKGLIGKSFSETSKQVSAAYVALSQAEKEAYARRASELREKILAEEKEKAEKAKESPTV